MPHHEGAAPATPLLRRTLAGLPAYVPGEAAAGDALHPLASNENPYGPLPGVIESLARAAVDVHRYPDMTGARLTAALAEHHRVPVEWVALGAGSVGVLQQIVQVAAGPGDEVVFAWRSFEAYPILVQLGGATAVRVPVTGAGRHDLAAMAHAITECTRLVLLCSPNNPTGPALRAGELLAFLDRVPGDVLVVLDEAYREFVRDPDVPDGIALAREWTNLCVLRTFSKAHGLAGLRVGYAVGAPEVAAALRTAALPFGVNTLAQAAALTSLGLGRELAARVETVVAERERVVWRLTGQGWHVPSSQGNFVWLATGARTAEVADACREGGVLVRPFIGEGLRATIGTPDANDAFLAVAGRFTPAPG